jgi:folate receptor
MTLFPSLSVSSAAVVHAIVSSASPVAAWEDTCTLFKNIYADGTELCEKMWADSFEVVDDDARAYTMWFFDQENNPNDVVTQNLFITSNSVPEQCHLQYFHKDTPGPEGDDMTECHPWKNNACCDSTTVQSAQGLNNAYGAGYRWDRCGPMSQACERFFVMEACLYECEPSAGLFRKFNASVKEDVNHPDYNEWQLYKMPIRKSFCDAWFTACANDYFCGNGDYFECAAYYYENQAEKDAVSSSSNANQGLIIGLSVAGAIAVVAVVLAGFLIKREKQGKPVFSAPEESAVTNAVSS